MAQLSRMAFNEMLDNVGDAVKRPCKRVFIGKYIADDGVYNVYIQVKKEKAGGRKGKQSQGSDR